MYQTLGLYWRLGLKENYGLGLPSGSSLCSQLSLPTHSLTHSLIYLSLTRSFLWATHVHSVYISSCLWTLSNYSRSHFPGIVLFPVFFLYFSPCVPSLCPQTKSHRETKTEIQEEYILPPHFLWLKIFH